MFLTEAANRGSVSTGYDIDNSLKLESDNTERVNKGAGTISGAGNRRTFTISFWTKRTEINGVKQYLFEAGNSDNNTDRFTLRFGTGDTFDIQSQNTWLVTNRVFRDTSAWYHFVIKVDTTDGTAANRIKLYVNGVEETSFSTDNRSSINQNHDFPVNNTEDHIIGNSQIEGSLYYNGYIAEWIQLDGTAAAPTSFGEFDEDSGIWKPKDPSALSFGTNGFWLDFEDSSNLGNDASGGTDFTLTNVAAADQATDTPTNNFATFNPLLTHGANDYFVVTNGSTHLDQTGQVGWGTSTATMAFNLGKWYAEFKLGSGVDVTMIGNSQIDDPQNYSASHLGVSANATSIGMGYYSANGLMYRNGGSTSYGDSYNTSGTIIGVALEFEANGTASMYVSKNGTWQNSADPAAGSGGFDLYYGNALPTGLHFTFAVSTYNNDGNIEANFGGFDGFTVSSGNTDANGYGNFEHAVPSGYYALCTKNLAEYG